MKAKIKFKLSLDKEVYLLSIAHSNCHLLFWKH